MRCETRNALMEQFRSTKEAYLGGAEHNGQCGRPSATRGAFADRRSLYQSRSLAGGLGGSRGMSSISIALAAWLETLSAGRRREGGDRFGSNLNRTPKPG